MISYKTACGTWSGIIKKTYGMKSFFKLKLTITKIYPLQTYFGRDDRKMDRIFRKVQKIVQKIVKKGGR